MKLSVEDFNILDLWDDSSSFYCEPGKRLKKTEFYIRKTRVYNMGVCSGEYTREVNWVFNVTKSQVFDHLGWTKTNGIKSHLDLSWGFPEFENRDKALLFLTVSIALHNETEH